MAETIKKTQTKAKPKVEKVIKVKPKVEEAKVIKEKVLKEKVAKKKVPKEKVVKAVEKEAEVEKSITVQVENSASYHAIGRRKRSVVRLNLLAGKGESTINGKPFLDVITVLSARKIILSPFTLTGTTNDYHFVLKVTGGGVNSQVIAIRHAVSRALSLVNEDYKKTLAINKFLRRDPREKERKKYFFVRARKRPQFSKR